MSANWIFVFRLAVTIVTLALADKAVLAAERPNVLLICVDDLKPALGCYGDQIAQSPNIDRLAARGTTLTSAYCNQAVCGPSRNALLTGLRPQSLGIYELSTYFRKAEPNAVALPEHFKNQGYRTESLGKIYHRGHGNQDDKQSWSVPSWVPTARKYQLAESWPKGAKQNAQGGNKKRKGKKRKDKNGKPYENADVADTAYSDGQAAEEAVRRLEEAAKHPDEPFFLAVGFIRPHLPFCAPKKYWDLYEPSQFALPKLKDVPEGAPEFAPTVSSELRNYVGVPKQGNLPDEMTRNLIHAYYASVSYMDAQVGRVLDALDKNGLADNTIVVLWGDHGWHLGDHGMWGKHTNYEQAARIPLIVVAPNKKNAGQQASALVESVDVYPTLSSLAGLPAPTNIDGSDFSKVLDDPRSETKDAVFHVFPRGQILGRAVRTDRYRLVEWKPWDESQGETLYELYDYQADPDETKNLASEQPEVVKEIKKILDSQPAAKSPINIAGQKQGLPAKQADKQKPVKNRS